MFKVEDFMNAFDPKAFDFSAVMANTEKFQKQTMTALAEQNIVTMRKAVDSINSQTSKVFSNTSK